MITKKNKETIEKVCIGVLIVMFILLIVASLWVNYKYNKLIIKSNNIIEEKENCFKNCPALREVDTHGIEYNGPFGFS